MKIRVFGIRAVGSIVAGAMVATLCLMANASDSQAGNVSSKTDESSDLASLKRQLYNCRHHKKRARRACPVSQAIEKRVVIEKQVIIERPVIIERERIVEKQVFVDRPTVVEKQVVVERPLEVERRVVVEHAAHHKHLLHFGIPFIGVNLF